MPANPFVFAFIVIINGVIKIKVFFFTAGDGRIIRKIAPWLVASAITDDVIRATTHIGLSAGRLGVQVGEATGDKCTFALRPAAIGIISIVDPVS